MKHIITEMWAFVGKDADGEEGLISYEMDGQHWPLVGSDLVRVDSLKKIAQQVANLAGRKVVLKKFSTMTVVEEYIPSADRN